MAAPGVAGLLITGGLEEGNDVIANAANWSDPFALTANDPTEEEEEEEGNDGDGEAPGDGDEDGEAPGDGDEDGEALEAG